MIQDTIAYLTPFRSFAFRQKCWLATEKWLQISYIARWGNPVQECYCTKPDETSMNIIETVIGVRKMRQ